jgi:predicted Ser/Thr protein kinase
VTLRAADSPAGARRIGRYELLDRLGEGGMGVVHLARGPTGDEVALKVLRPHVVADDEGRARLAREVTSLRRVRSPRVAEVYDADPWGELPFVVTRYVRGISLHELVRDQGGLGADDLRFLALGLAEALAAVHDAGVLHRDIKPSNVLMEGRAPVLIDFGLAKLAEDSKLTATGWLLGTPGYLAPEVLYGDSATPAADVHAWAATVTYAAGGASPYGGGPVMAVLDRARRGEHDLSLLPADLLPLIRQCLAPDPQQRPGAHEVVSRLRAPDRAAPPLGEAPPSGRSTRLLGVPVRTDPPRPAPSAWQGEPPTWQGEAQGERPVVPARSSSVLRSMIVMAALAVVAAALSLAPYVAAAGSFVLAWLFRTMSWGADALSDRRARRGPRRSDSVVATLTAPWYVVAALPGTVVLFVGASLSGAGGAVLGWVLGLGVWLSLAVGGAAFVTALWWGPGSRQLRRGSYRPVRAVATADRSGALWLAGLLAVTLALLAAHSSMQVLWWPDDAPPVDVLSWPVWLQP